MARTAALTTCRITVFVFLYFPSKLQAPRSRRTAPVIFIFSGPFVSLRLRRQSMIVDRRLTECGAEGAICSVQRTTVLRSDSYIEGWSDQMGKTPRLGKAPFLHGNRIPSGDFHRSTTLNAVRNGKWRPAPNIETAGCSGSVTMMPYWSLYTGCRQPKQN